MRRGFSVQQGLGTIFCSFALVPWANFGTNNLDSQPWPIIFGLAFIFACGPVIKAPPHTALALGLVATGFLITIGTSIAPSTFTLIRAALNYMAIFIAYVAFYNYVSRYGFPWRIIVVVNLLWLAMGLIETVLPSVTEAISPRRTTEDRGVTSLAPEPTFFAIYLFFSSWLMLSASSFRPRRMVWLLILVNALAIIFLAKSTMGVLFIALAVAGTVWYKLLPFRLTRRSGRTILVALVALPVVVLFSGDALEQSRIAKVSEFLSQNSFADVVMWDASINQRLEAVVISLHGAAHHYLWPAGLDTFLVTRSAIIDGYNGLFWYPTGSLKIMSWIGVIVYELGIFGSVAFVLIFVSAYSGRRLSRISLTVLGLILLSAVPPSFPLVPMLLAFMAFEKKRTRDHRLSMDKEHFERRNDAGAELFGPTRRPM